MPARLSVCWSRSPDAESPSGTGKPSIGSSAIWRQEPPPDSMLADQQTKSLGSTRRLVLSEYAVRVCPHGRRTKLVCSLPARAGDGFVPSPTSPGMEALQRRCVPARLASPTEQQLRRTAWDRRLFASIVRLFSRDWMHVRMTRFVFRHLHSSKSAAFIASAPRKCRPRPSKSIYTHEIGIDIPP